LLLKLGSTNANGFARASRRTAGAVFGLALATLVPFLVEKGASPRGQAVLWFLYAAIGISLAVWLATSAVIRRSETQQRPRPLEIIYSLDGSPEMRVPFRSGRPQSILISVGLKNPNPFNLDGIAINCLFPQGMRVERCGARGETLENPKGHWLSTPERLPDEPPPGTHKDYWADENLTIAGNGSKLLFFKLQLTRPANLHFLTRVFGSVPACETPATLEVVETESMFLGGIVNELIHDGEALASSASNVFFENSAEYRQWKTELIFATAVLEGEDRQWWVEATRPDVPGAGDEWRSNMAARDVPILYDLRRRLDRPVQMQAAA
jgi:hypothetical protein